MQTIYLKMDKKNEVSKLFAVQRDVGRKFKAVITDGNEEFRIPDDAVFSVWYSGTSGEGNYTAIGERSAFFVEGNTVTVELIAQMLVNKGGGIMSLVMHSGDGIRIGMWNIFYTVEELPGADSAAAEAYYDAFSEKVAQVMEAAERLAVDASLSAEGQPADAAAVGRALAGKAPAVESSEFPGCYYRTASGGVEWVNPPGVPGVEYRTTERYNGNPVYTKVVSCGTLDVGSWKTQDYTGATGIVLRYSGFCGGTAIPFNPFPVADPNNNITLGVIPGTIYISKGSTCTVSGNITVQLWYAK